MTSVYTKEDLKYLPLKELKSIAVELGIKGTTSRSRYTKRNKDKLIEDIIFETRGSASENIEDSTTNNNEEMSSPKVLRSVKDHVDEQKPERKLEPKQDLEQEQSSVLILGGVAVIVVVTAFMFGNKIIAPQRKRVDDTQQIGEPPKHKIITDI